MSGRQWTQPQQSAIEDTGGALLVSAAAGSGKTAVLVERAVTMITRKENPISAERLLILTFTNAAAEELRSRIAVRLEEELHAHPHNTALARQRIQLRRAFIGTMDAFCQQLVRENFAGLGLPPDIAVGDESLLRGLFDAAMDETLEEMFDDGAFATFAALYGQARSDRGAVDAIEKLYRFTGTLPGPKRQLAGFAAMYEAAVPFEDTPWAAELLGHAGLALQEALRLAGASLELAEETDGFAAYVPALSMDVQGIEALVLLAGQKNWDGLVEAARGHEFARLAPCKGDAEVKGLIQANREALKKILGDLKKYTFACTRAECEEDRAVAAPMVAGLCRAAGLFMDKYYAAKLEERVLDFGDFEHLALQLLLDEDGKRTPAARAVSGRYDAVMVDEYQDTNELQDALYRCLAGEDGANLFFVGDAKQSIYRFRQANPGIFLQKKESWAPVAEGTHPARVDLGHNFRSSRGVIDGVNYLFSFLMSPALGEMAYGEEERLICGVPDAAEGGFAVDILDGGTVQNEAAHVAARISQMVKDGVPVAEGGGQRPCAYGDFCILMRARRHMPAFVAALEEAGIPLVADLSETLLQTPEVAPLVAVLCAIDNPGDDVSLAASLLGPLFRFTAEEVARLRTLQKRGRLWGILAASAEPKCRAFVEEFRYYRALAAEMPVGKLCEVLVGKTAYLSAVAAMEGGLARRENLLRFMGWAAEVGAGLRGGLSGFVRILQEGRGPAAPGAKTVPGHVSILTIHKSKGLEFPFVFLSDAAHAFQLTGLSDRVQVHQQLGMGIVLRQGDELYPTLPALAIRSRAIREELSEEMRLLYVALTRAKQQVTVSFAAKDAQKLLGDMAVALAGEAPGPFALSRQRSMAHWVLAAVLRHPDGVALLNKLAIPTPGALPCEGRFALRIVQPGQGVQEEKGAFHLTAEPDEELVQTLQAAFVRVPARQRLAEVPAKMSVSALAKKGQDGLRKRPSFMYASGLSAAERGTAQHMFLQFADFEAARDDVSAEVERLRKAGFLSDAAAAAIDEEGVRAFLASDLMARMKRAERAMREYDFITAVPAGTIHEELPEELAQEPVLVQGIADLVLAGQSGAEIVDYKTDGGIEAEELVERYKTQLWLYRRAIEKKLGVPVEKLTIWSFALRREVDVPLEDG